MTDRLGAVVLVCCCAIACSRPADEAPLSWRPGMLGPSVVLADRSPNQLSGDFNGDGLTDLLAVVVVRSPELARDVRVVRPWQREAAPAPADDVATGAQVSLAIIHGAGDGRATGAYLLHDPESVSILDTGAGRELAVIPRSALTPREGLEVPDRGRGDMIVVPTEAGIDTYIYWDGSTYRSLVPREVP
jgi:hypothetical protein